MTTTEQPAHSMQGAVTVTLPISSTRMPLHPTQGFDILRREIRSSYKVLLADFDATLAALGISVAPTILAPSRKRRWHR